MSSEKNGTLIVISAPSGCGKTTVVKELLKRKSLSYSISATTRRQREGERQGHDYFFLSEKEFKQGIRKKHFLEWANVFGNYYGTPKAQIEKLLKAGHDVLLDIDVQGARQLMESKLDALFIFMLPPSMKELKRRLIQRRTDTKKDIHKRLEVARQEMELASQYDYVVVNKKVAETKNIIEMIIKSEKYKSKR